MQCNRRISRETNDRDASLGLAFQKSGSAFLISGDDPSGDGKGTQQQHSECRFRIWNKLIKMK